MKGYEALGPGLHRIGPYAWDFVYNPAKGQVVTVVHGDFIMTGVIADFDEAPDGQLRLTIGDTDEMSAMH